MKNTQELRELTTDDLKQELLNVRKEQFHLRLKKSNGTLEKTHGFVTARRMIARIKTLLTERSENANG